MRKIECIGDVKSTNGHELLINSHQLIEVPEGTYQIEIKTIPKKRSLRQNRYLWLLIGEIAKKEDGDLRNEDTLYCHLLEMAGAKYEVIYIDEEAINSLIQHEIVRHIVIKRKKESCGRVMCEAYLFYGSSKMDSKEMSELIDTTLRYAGELGINTPYWEDLLK